MRRANALPSGGRGREWGSRGRTARTSNAMQGKDMGNTHDYYYYYWRTNNSTFIQVIDCRTAESHNSRSMQVILLKYARGSGNIKVSNIRYYSSINSTGLSTTAGCRGANYRTGNENRDRTGEHGKPDVVRAFSPGWDKSARGRPPRRRPRYYNEAPTSLTEAVINCSFEELTDKPECDTFTWCSMCTYFVLAYAVSSSEICSTCTAGGNENWPPYLYNKKEAKSPIFREASINRGRTASHLDEVPARAVSLSRCTQIAKHRPILVSVLQEPQRHIIRRKKVFLISS